jgi:hypothetical protein
LALAAVDNPQLTTRILGTTVDHATVGNVCLNSGRDPEQRPANRDS